MEDNSTEKQIASDLLDRFAGFITDILFYLGPLILPVLIGLGWYHDVYNADETWPLHVEFVSRTVPGPCPESGLEILWKECIYGQQTITVRVLQAPVSSSLVPGQLVNYTTAYPSHIGEAIPFYPGRKCRFAADWGERTDRYHSPCR